MKNLYYPILILYFLSFFQDNLIGQDLCKGSFTEYVLNSNNIRASFFPRGNKFTDGTQGKFLVPYPHRNELSTIFASSPWIGGFDDAMNLKLAAETYPGGGLYDFSVGPLSSIGTQIDSICERFDQAWSVYYEDIQNHRMDFLTDGIIDDTISNVFGWPARGNKFFPNYYGFELPFDNQGLATFHDWNSNNIYDPENGDYPVVRLTTGGTEYIPDQILWMVFNDTDDNWPLTSNPLRFEIQLTAFAYHCQDNEILNNTIFNSYKILSRAVSAVDSVFFGFWTDYDLGCPADDFIGSDSIRNTEFVYNADMVDGTVGSDCFSGIPTYADIPPVQSMTYLSHPMNSFIQIENVGPPIEIYRSLNGIWSDGSPIRPENDGHSTNAQLGTTKFLYHGDPRDTTSWAAINVLSAGSDPRTVSSVYLGRMDPGAIRAVVTAYMFHLDTSKGHLDQITTMYSNVDSLRKIIGLHPHLEFPCTPFPFCEDDDCVWPGDFDKNGIADHRDYLMWGAMNGSTGPERNGLVSWRGQYAEDWSDNIGGINAKHGDGDGSGLVDINDIQINTENFLLTNDDFENEVSYPQGNEIVISAFPIDNAGRIRNLMVRSGEDLENVLGLAFELEYDTSLFSMNIMIPLWTDDNSVSSWSNEPDVFLKAAFVQTNNNGIALDSNSTIARSIITALSIKSGMTIPECTTIKLRNLTGIDDQGNDLHLGANNLVVCKEGVSGTQDSEEDKIQIYPNPANGQFWIDAEYPVMIEILNSLGTSLKSIRVTSNDPVDISGYPAGIYFLRFSGHSKTYKLVVY